MLHKRVTIKVKSVTESNKKNRREKVSRYGGVGG